MRSPRRTVLAPGPDDLDLVDENTVRCFDPVAAEAMVAAVKAAAKEGTRSAAWPRCWPTAYRWAWAAMCTGTASSMRCWRRLS